ncbi:MAG TPA: serine/threonine-protein kinase [Myxococcus sp.]|nr:serine/threonine-protein kinase [Myxococcus sp.]
MQPGPLNPASLPTGARVGPWSVVDRRGSGTYGVVYLVEGVAPEASGLAALKVAHHPWNERFRREVELLSRLRHPSVPRLLGEGAWLSPTGQSYPWFVMELVEGIPLYAWGQAFNPSSRQVLRVLAGVARALEATHAVGGVHRDVKGDNILVRLSDGLGVLIDFGSGYHSGATTLTWQVFPPGTPAYRSPEAYRFALNIRQQPVKVYAPGPAEDVFALGVAAYRLVTGEYPPLAEPLDAQFHVWRTEGPGPRPAHELNPDCCRELSRLISRMLFRQPEARGTAREVAEALEKAARKAGPEADRPLFHGRPERPAPVRPGTEVPTWNWRPWLAMASVAGALAMLGVASRLSTPVRMEFVRAPVTEQEEARDAGAVGVGDSVLTAPVASPHAPSAGTSISVGIPPRPFPGQLRPDANGRCRYKSFKSLVPINDGCWTPMNEDPKDCAASEAFYYKGACYVPFFPFDRPAPSSPPESRDGG